jgi:hypothetical protein
MAEAPLKDFVRSALQAGASREDTRTALQRAGWPAEQIQDALGQYAELDFVVPVPRPRAHVSARDAFLYLVMFSMLYLSVYHLGNLLFQFINLLLPDVTQYDYREGQLGSIRFSIATLLIAWPLFLWLATHIQQQVAREPAQRLSAIRKWLTWLTLALAACVIAGDLIYLVFRLLSGELSLRFLLKVLVTGLLAGSSFGYYFWLMGQDDRELMKGDAV